MIETVVKAPLPVGEALVIQKNRIAGADPKSHRLAIVTGTHGDELEGQYVAWQLARVLEEKKDRLQGTVDIYPALNPLGISTIYRGLPGFDLDMNRIFPGSRNETMYEYIANGIIRDIKGADLCIDIHASNIFLREIPQVRINEKTATVLTPLAKLLNMDFICHLDPQRRHGTGEYTGLQPEYAEHENAGSGDGRRHAHHPNLWRSADYGHFVRYVPFGDAGRTGAGSKTARSKHGWQRGLYQCGCIRLFHASGHAWGFCEKRAAGRFYRRFPERCHERRTVQPGGRYGLYAA